MGRPGCARRPSAWAAACAHGVALGTDHLLHALDHFLGPGPTDSSRSSCRVRFVCLRQSMRCRGVSIRLCSIARRRRAFGPRLRRKLTALWACQARAVSNIITAVTLRTVAPGSCYGLQQLLGGYEWMNTGKTRSQSRDSAHRGLQSRRGCEKRGSWLGVGYLRGGLRPILTGRDEAHDGRRARCRQQQRDARVRA